MPRGSLLQSIQKYVTLGQCRDQHPKLLYLCRYFNTLTLDEYIIPQNPEYTFLDSFKAK